MGFLTKLFSGKSEGNTKSEEIKLLTHNQIQSMHHLKALSFH